MTHLDLARQRLHNQRLAGTPLEKPEVVLRWLCAVLAQDYDGAKWGISQRTAGATNAAIDSAFNAGTILRTHLLRPTWYFVAPADIRWMLSLTAPRVHAANASYYRKFGFDDAVFRRTNALLADALQGGKQLTRAELAIVLERGGIAARGLPLAYLLMHAELDEIICSGALRGRKFTYALLEEQVPQATTMDHDEALAELARRYFTSRGPARIQDFVQWSGLEVADAKAGVEIARSHLMHETVNGRTYWFDPSMPISEGKAVTVHLLAKSDEFFKGYKDQSHTFDPSLFEQKRWLNGPLRRHFIVRDGLIIGAWTPTLHKNEVAIQTKILTRLTESEQAALEAAADGYGQFMELPVALSIQYVDLVASEP